jgi:hypothetical protein
LTTPIRKRCANPDPSVWHFDSGCRGERVINIDLDRQSRAG